MISTEQVLKEMKRGGMRITRQRRLIIDTILQKDYTSCKDIYYQVRNRDRTIGISTVYRLVRQLEDMGVLERIEMIHVHENMPVLPDQEEELL